MQPYIVAGILLLVSIGGLTYLMADPPIRPLIVYPSSPWTVWGSELMDNDMLLAMIAQTEAWDGESVGASGERGPCQMLVSTWKNYSTEDMPYTRRAWDKPEPQRVLHAHASWIRDQMERKRLTQTPYTFALMWKAGYGRAVNHRERPVDVAYAIRAAALYRELVK